MERSYGAAAFEFIGDQCGNGRSNLVEMTRKKFSVEKVEIGRTGSKLAEAESGERPELVELGRNAGAVESRGSRVEGQTPNARARGRRTRTSTTKCAIKWATKRESQVGDQVSLTRGQICCAAHFTELLHNSIFSGPPGGIRSWATKAGADRRRGRAGLAPRRWATFAPSGSRHPCLTLQFPFFSLLNTSSRKGERQSYRARFGARKVKESVENTKDREGKCR